MCGGETERRAQDLTAIRWSVGSSLILLAFVLGISLFFPDAQNAAKPGETSSGISEQRSERQDLLVEPALNLKQLVKSHKEETAAELALPSGLPTGLPQKDLNLADGMNDQEEAIFLATLYAAKYGVDSFLLGEVVRCESTYNPTATGREGERGHGQFLRSTFLGTPQGKYGWEAAYNPAVNIEAIAWMLSQERADEFHAVPCPDR